MPDSHTLQCVVVTPERAVLDEPADFVALPMYDGELGILPHVIEQALNHVSGAKAGVAGVYNRAKMSDAVRSALQAWADHIDRITK